MGSGTESFVNAPDRIPKAGHRGVRLGVAGPPAAGVWALSGIAVPSADRRQGLLHENPVEAGLS